MRPSERLKGNEDKIIEIVEANNASNPRIFGSVARGEDREDSDLDIVINKKGRLGLFKLSKIGSQIADLIGCDVDLVIEENIDSQKFSNEICMEAVDLWLNKKKN